MRILCARCARNQRILSRMVGSRTVSTSVPAELLTPTPAAVPLLLDELHVGAPLAARPLAPRPAVGDQIVDDLVELATTFGVVMELIDEPPGPGRRCRFYSVHLQLNLFNGAVDLVRTWGRAGIRHLHPRHLSTVHPDEGTARAALRPLLMRRLRRGYRPRGSSAAVASSVGAQPARGAGDRRCGRPASDGIV
jgi:predicted DNA-binding WGR domain protein